jgi:hypothetical protein
MKGWYDDSGKDFKKLTGKGKRLIIVHAGGETGFVPNGLLIFKSFVTMVDNKKHVHLNFNQTKIVKKDK